MTQIHAIVCPNIMTKEPQPALIATIPAANVLEISTQIVWNATKLMNSASFKELSVSAKLGIMKFRIIPYAENVMVDVIPVTDLDQINA